MSTSISTQKKLYHHISGSERYIIARLLHMKYSMRAIARNLGRSVSSISEEIKRNGGKRVYDADIADTHARMRWKHTHQKTRLANPVLREYVEACMKEGYSPQQIVGRASITFPYYKLNHETIYLYVYNDARHLITYMRKSRVKRKSRTQLRRNKTRIPHRVSIHARGDVRNEYGNYEADLVGASSKSTIMILRELRTHYIFLRKVPNAQSITVKNEISRIMESLPPEVRKSITYDNGSENVLHQEINNEYGMQSYFL